MDVEIREEAVTELRSIRLWLRERSEQAETLFLADLERAFRQLESFPNSGSPHIRGTRKLVLHRTKYLVIYTVRDQTVTIRNIAHTSRRPGYWLRPD